MRILIVCAALVAGTPAVAAEVTTAVPATSAATFTAAKGQMLSSADRARLGTVMRVEGDGSVAIIFDAHMVTIPASTLSSADGKLTTSLNKREVASLR